MVEVTDEVTDGVAFEAGPADERASVLVVDDEESVRRVLQRLLERNGYDCGTAADGDAAVALMRERPFNVVLTDMTMPGMSGLELVENLEREHPDTATIMVTGTDDRALAEAALEHGAYGYVVKPFEHNEILIGISNALRRRTLEMRQRNEKERLEEMVSERTRDLWTAIAQLEKTQQELRESREETVRRLSIAAEFRDRETSDHLLRMSRYCELIAARAGFDSDACDVMRVASIMHDVGKIGIPDKILQKPGSLTPDEREVMQKHAEIGHQILTGSESPFLKTAALIALTHHERWDGAGYPRGLVGEEIPIEGRIAAIADVFDALSTKRVYKPAFALGKAIEIMRAEKGLHFDPDLLDLFFDVMDQVIRIKEAVTEPQSRSI